MARKRIPSGFFVFVVVEHEGHVLLVRETKHGQLWYAPAGGMEPGETIREAAIRETLEEAGVLVEPIDIIRIDQEWHPGETGLTSWWRFIIRARPVGSTTPKRQADSHTLEARWVRPERIREFPLRHMEVHELVALAERAPPALPIDMPPPVARTA
jgi:ADP-ribose pyrophosphatase YjhB (NUDIX family)